MRSNGFRTWLQSALVLALAACGGGGDGGIGGTGGTPPGSDVSIGTITAFGSVWVNGVEFKSNTATIKIDDNPHPESDLRVGMIARVNGSISGAQASEILVGSAAKGWVESVSGNQMVVMGQTVNLDASTVLSNGAPAVGNFAEVHGTVASDGTIAASFVERKSPVPSPLAFAVKGFVKGHAANGTTFQVGALNVALGTGATTNDMPSGASWNGILVEVKGTGCAGNPPASNVCGTLTASKVEPHTPRANVGRIEVEGVVTSGNSAGFNIGSQAVVTNGSTRFEGGVATDLVVGTKVEVEGSISGGVLTATKVSFRENIRFEANVAATSGNTFTLQGLAGITIDTNAATRFDKVSGVAGLAANHNVRVRARPGSGGTVVATEVELRSTNASTDVRFRAIATATISPNLTMLGLTINTSNIPQFRDLIDASITRDAFFNAVVASGSTGRLVEVRGTQSGATINWNREAQLESD
ncbi:MAG: DUF5666 domain-containing protein [Burkholderiaceae bacterium]